MMHPPLTTVRQPIEEMGRLGVRTLLAQIKGDATACLARLPTELILRESVGPPRPTLSFEAAKTRTIKRAEALGSPGSGRQ
jgi:hypothetical protein